MNRRTFLSIALVAPAFQQAGKKQPGKVVPPASLPPASSPGVPWTQWGGPHRNFQTEASGLKDTWPASGPRVIWKRSLGEGYSSPAVENGVLYTMYGKPKVEVVLATDAETGRTLWEQATPAAFQSDAPEQGNGPYSTPLIAGERLFTTGVAGRLQCIDKKTGIARWTQQLWDSHQGTRLMYGYASSPIAYRNMVIVPVGGRGKAVMAFDQATGTVAWQKNDYANTYSSPILISVDGLEQLVLL
ncbi:MAG TPA: PQQ-binding-like beta-propeller repeat protein, partial [Vicinamibacterales bacterium]|nr:PQQ-binding-like beta-propeller repeat protein [Vicinamibacterales bacterium]